MRPAILLLGAISAGAAALALGAVIRPQAAPQAVKKEPDGDRAAAARPIDGPAARDLIARGALLIDVREPDELRQGGKLKGALNLPLSMIRKGVHSSFRAQGIEVPKDRPVILYCRTGRRSQMAGDMLLREGIGPVYNLGGVEEAAASGFPKEET